mmetsp:Transcript_44003/g.101559  ORF Transcript_44003/g.101559 Transcript_44003/m.101559 type:complete len:115 (-) Transcript_44003:187-531(-)
MRVELASKPVSELKQFCIKCSATCASTAAKGSSRRYSAAPLYAALAKATLAFCPPDRLRPRSPISVSAPFGSSFKSCSKAQACTTCSKRSALYSCPSRTLRFKLPYKIQGACGQ